MRRVAATRRISLFNCRELARAATGKSGGCFLRLNVVGANLVLAVEPDIFVLLRKLLSKLVRNFALLMEVCPFVSGCQSIFVK
jgi:hypothetical protein